MSLSASQLEDRQAREQFLNRPLPNELRDKYITLFSHPDLTLEDLQEQATARQGLGDVEDELGGVTLRSLFWRIYLGTLNVNQVLSSTPRALLSNSLRDQRQQYDALRRKWLISPDGRWATDCTSPDVVDGSFDGSSTSEGTKQAESVVNGIAWDPLNLGETNPWQTWFAQTELRGTIDKDVERTFPDIPYFRDPYVRRVLKTVLFLWAMENSDITYRQGMHELLAVIMLVCDRDSLNRDTLPAKNSQSSYIGNDRYLNVPMSPLQSQLEDGRHSPSGEKMEDAMYMVLDRRFLEHDVHGLFVKLMEHAGSWYEWRTETIEGSLAQDRSKQKQVTKGRIIAMCQHMQGVLLKQVDPVLWQTLENAAIEPQIWGIRWIRVLFTREFPFASALRLWDGLFAIRDQMDDLVESVCVAMLLRIRQLVIGEDYGVILTSLLRYPPRTSALPLDVSLIFAQAMKVLKDPTIATGAAIALENQEVLGIQPLKLDAPETPIPSNTSAFRSKRQPQAFGRGQFGPASSPAKGYGFESFTRGLMDRAQASGIDKALLTTVSTLSEFRKNLPEIPTTTTGATFPFRSFTPDRATTPSGATQFPTMDSLSSHLAPLHTPARTVQDADRDIADLRLAMVGMGKTMANWLETVEESCGIVSEGRLETALQGLRRLRETLINGATTTTTELAKDWAWSHELATTPSIYSTVSTDSPLDTDGVPLEALAGDMTTSSGINQQSAGPPHQEKDAIPTDTFPLGSTPSTASSPMYLQSPSNFSRTPRSQYTSHTASSQRVAPTRNAQEPALSLHESTDFQMERRPIANDTQFQESAATPSLKIAERETFSVQARNLHNVDVDPLSGQVTVTGEHGSSVYGLKRLSRDPLKGLGIL